MGFLKFLFFAIVGIWLLGLIIRAVFSRWLRRRTEEYNRAAENARKEARRQARSNRREGEVTVDATEAVPEKKVSRGVGEYVEFEEVTITEMDETGKTGGIGR